MNFFDIIIVIVISFCLIRGLFRGFIREVASIIGVVAGFYGAYTYYGSITPLLTRFVANEGYRDILGFFILFCLVFILVSLVAMVIRYLLNIVFLGWFDQLCGMGFGAVKGCLIISIMIIGFTTFVPRGPDMIAGSRLSVHVATVSAMMSTLVSGQMRIDLQNRLEGMQQIWEKQKKTPQSRV
ncbi:MAG: CvpA family protein [Pseudomonadota bacterium]